MQEINLKNRIHIIKGDITRIQADAIVNAANSSLMGGGGVDGAIHCAGGALILEECRAIVSKYGDCKTGEAVITSAGNLPARFVIHTVGPVWKGGSNQEAEKLASCYRNSLLLAGEHELQSIAFPNISTGVYGFPKDKAAMIAYKTVSEFLSRNVTPPTVTFVCFDDENFQLLQKHYHEIN